MLPTPQRAGAFSTVLSALWVRSAFLADRLIWPSLTPGNTIGQAMLTSWAAPAVLWPTSPSVKHPTESDNYGVQVNFKPSRSFQLGGWYGYTKAQQLRGGNNDATIQNGAITLALADIGRQGNLLGFVFGVPPKVTESDVARNRNTSYHLEGFYRFQVNDFVSVTPGVYVILNPEHNNRNDDIWVGLLRTTFSF
jgi:hypothetical protein